LKFSKSRRCSKNSHSTMDKERRNPLVQILSGRLAAEAFDAVFLTVAISPATIQTREQ
jgi:hypothetical protein